MSQLNMTDGEETNKSIFPDALSHEEPELNSISFKESLRFFRDQLTDPVVPLDDGKQQNAGIKKMSENPTIEEYAITQETPAGKATSYSSSRILPIPTVDTILESVRILRAIQKSQEQRGKQWPLDITSSTSEELDTYKLLELDLQKDLLHNGSISAVVNGNGESDISHALSSPNVADYSVDAKNNNAALENDENWKNVENGTSFWPTLLSVARNTETDVIKKSPGSKSESACDIETDQHQPNINHDAQRLKNFNSTSTLAGISLSEDLLTIRESSVSEDVQDYVSCSTGLPEYQSETKFEIPMSERSTSTELDSGMGTDKSVGSLSPVRGEVDADKDLWSDSSHSQYASAAGSPCESLTGTPDSLDFSSSDLLEPGENIAAADDKCVAEKEARCSQFQSKDINNTFKTEEFCSAPTSTGNMVVSESSNGSNGVLQGNSYESGNHICLSKDRLVETIEDKIQQRKFGLDELCTPEMKISKNLPRASKCLCSECCDSPSSLKNSVCTKLLESVSSENDSLNSVRMVYNSTHDKKRHDDGLFSEDVINTGKTKLKNANYGPNIPRLSDKETDAISDNSVIPVMEEGVYVTSVQCVLGSAAPVVPVTETESTDQEEEPQRTKKNVTFSWDPVPLMKHLYHIEEQVLLKGAQKTVECMEGYVFVQPFGIFSNSEGSYYSVLQEHNLYIYESDKKEKLMLKIPLQYASIECSAKNAILLDNKVGKCISLQYPSEQEMLKWKENLSSHSASLSKFSEVLPVNYPLKSFKDVIVIDLGSCSTRAGILMDQPTLPKLFFPTVCATDKSSMAKSYGIEALLPEIRQNSILSFPVRQSAKVTKFTMDIDSLKGLFEKIFHDLNVDQRKFTVQLSVPRSLSTDTQMALMKLLIEDLGVQAVSLTRQALLTLYANNTSSAIVVDIGERMDVLPVVDGFILECGVSKLPYGGQQIIHHMKHALAQKHISLSNDVESFVVRYIAESLCYVSENYEDELHNATYFPEHVKKSLPLYPFFKDESKIQTVTLDIGRFQVPEGLFTPDLWGLDFPGLHKLVYQAIQSSGMDMRRRMAENIFVSGGVTLIPGFVERLQNEVAKLTLPRLKPQIRASPYRYHMAYLGACQLAASEAFQQVCVSNKEWRAKGPLCLRKWHL